MGQSFSSNIKDHHGAERALGHLVVELTDELEVVVRPVVHLYLPAVP
ncbi:MAG: hypothetical protein ACJAZO_003520 [Myxococcota bacterium]